MRGQSLAIGFGLAAVLMAGGLAQTYAQDSLMEQNGCHLSSIAQRSVSLSAKAPTGLFIRNTNGCAIGYTTNTPAP